MKDRVALVSGGARGIGRAIAERFQREGARVVILDCDAAAGKKSAEELSAGQRGLAAVQFIRTDLRNPEEIREAMKLVGKEHGRVEVLVNNAAIEVGKAFAELTLEDWNAVIEVNLRGAFLLTQAALPLFGDDGA